MAKPLRAINRHHTGFRLNRAGWRDLRNNPNLVEAMTVTAQNAVNVVESLRGGFPDKWNPDERLVVWPHRGKKTGGRTSVQVWGVQRITNSVLIRVFQEMKRSNPF